MSRAPLPATAPSPCSAASRTFGSASLASSASTSSTPAWPAARAAHALTNGLACRANRAIAPPASSGAIPASAWRARAGPRQSAPAPSVAVASVVASSVAAPSSCAILSRSAATWASMSLQGRPSNPIAVADTAGSGSAVAAMIAAQPSAPRRQRWWARTASTRTLGSGSSSAAGTTSASAVPSRFVASTTWRRTPQSASCSNRSAASAPSWLVWTRAAVAVRRMRAAASVSGSPGGTVSLEREAATLASAEVRVSTDCPPRAKASIPRAKPSRAARPGSYTMDSNRAAASARPASASARCSGLSRMRRPRLVARLPSAAGSDSSGIDAASTPGTVPGSEPKTDCASAKAAAARTAGASSRRSGSIWPARAGSPSRPRARTATARIRGSSLRKWSSTRSSPALPRASSSATISA